MMKSIFICLAVLSMSFASSASLRADSQSPDHESAIPSAAASDVEEEARIPDHLVIDGREVGHRVEPRDGEICTVCGKPITQHDVTYIVEGQRVAVHKGPCLEALAAKPVEWLSKLRPRGALLDAAATRVGVSPGWLILGSYVLLGLIFGALSAHRAFSVGRDPLTWLVIGFLTNIIGYAVSLALPRREVHAPEGVPAGLGKVAATYSPQACPSCGAENHPSARVCCQCGRSLVPHVVSEVQKAGLDAH